MTERKRILNRIGQVLKEKGRNNKWLAVKLGVHINTVSQWVHNEQQPHLEVFYQISVLLDCNIHDLIVSTKPSSKISRA
jgi:hypothetical protein